MMRRLTVAASGFRLDTIAVACLVLLAAGSGLRAGDWPQFLGPTRNGLSAETGLLAAWPEGGPREAWRVEGGVGMSAVAVSQGRAFTMVQKAGRQAVLALDAASGKTLWQTEVADAYKNTMGDGPRGTPAVTGDEVYIYTGEGILVSLTAADGKIRWQHNVVKELGGEVADYGMACSPLVHEGLVVVAAGAPAATLAAYRRGTGELAWKAGEKDAAGYSSPTVLEVGGQRQLVFFNGDAAQGLAPATGQALWRHPYVTGYKCNVATPVLFQGQILISAGENHGTALLALQASGNGFQAKETWASQGVQSTLRSEWQTPILLGDHAYGFDNIGSAGPVTHLTCIETATGKRVWQQPRFGKGNFIAADGKLFCTTMKGELVVVAASPKGYEELGRATYLKTTRQAPALADGFLYLRDDKDVLCLDVRKPKP